ncbi:hypothetical protein AVEN_39936-1 [Araneus ventricosus]|uniref:Uncharacterized protein n=1 Tax=Araneus ventricosus TaxID=182803 RepID=A0A4Y2G476_ARAVE|nr:hypothetical protein AVEN_39936-1 [Araneus ventricosus]
MGFSVLQVASLKHVCIWESVERSREKLNLACHLPLEWRRFLWNTPWFSDLTLEVGMRFMGYGELHSNTSQHELRFPLCSRNTDRISFADLSRRTKIPVHI